MTGEGVKGLGGREGGREEGKGGERGEGGREGGREEREGRKGGREGGEGKSILKALKSSFYSQPKRTLQYYVSYTVHAVLPRCYALLAVTPPPPLFSYISGEITV